MNTHNVAATHLTAHLTEDQFADYTIGLSTPAMDLHIEQCATCRAEALAMQESIGAFATAGRAWSEQQPAPSAQNFRRRALLVQMRPVAAFAAAAVVVFAVTFSTHHPEVAQQHTAVTAPAPILQPATPVIADEAQPESIAREPAHKIFHAAPAEVTAIEVAQDNAMMAAIDAEITAPFAVAPDVGHAFNGQSQ